MKLINAFAVVQAASLLMIGHADAQQGRSGSNSQETRSGVTSRGQSPISRRTGMNGPGGLSQQGALGQPGGGPGMGGPGQQAGGGGPMATGLAETAGDRFQEGGFVGRDADDVRASFDNMSSGDRRGSMMDMMIENLNEMRDSQRRWREQRQAPPPVRVRLVPAFEMPAASAFNGAAQVQSRLTKTLQLRGVGSPQVEIAGRTAFLRGAVPTARDRALIERLASLEPGVSRVENLLTIESAPPSGAPQ